MDHLPRPSGSVEPLEFPYFELSGWEHHDETYSFWMQYPEYIGWKIELLQSRTPDCIDEVLQGRSFLQLAVFLQSWLYFGLLTQYLERVVEKEDFVKTSSTGSLVLCTRSLLPSVREYAEHVRCRAEELGYYTLFDYKKRREMLSFVGEILPFLQGHGTNSDAQSLSCIGVSTALLVETLGNATVEIWRRVEGKQDTEVVPIEHFPIGGYGSIIESKLEERGWCKSDIVRMVRESSLSAICYASMIQKMSDVSHKDCPESACTAHNIPTGLYKPKHAYLECHCEGLGLPARSAEDILDLEETFPLISLWVNKEVDPPTRQFRAVAFRPGLKYIALSHVWSDGLGDEVGNEILACQYDRIKQLLLDLTGSSPQMEIKMEKDTGSNTSGSWSPYFWLDTICVPRETKYRRVACARMSASYSNAEAVLVLDSELYKWSYSLGSDEEALIRISVGAWIKRVWTLSEGVLARRLVFKFADATYDLASAEKRIIARSKDLAGRFEILLKSAFEPIQGFRRIRDQELADQVVDAWRSTQLRRTSHAGDDIISLAVLLNLDHIENLFNEYDLYRRMMLFWQYISQIPDRLVFFTGPKLRFLGFRWAPSDPYGGIAYNHHGSLGVLDDRGGLRVNFPGFLLSSPWEDLDRPNSYCCYQVEGFEETWYRLRSSGGWHRHGWPEDLEKYENELQSTKLGVILDLVSFESPTITNIDAVLVSNVVEEEDGTIACRYQRRIWAEKLKYSEKSRFFDGPALGTYHYSLPLHVAAPVKRTCRYTKDYPQKWRIL